MFKKIVMITVYCVIGWQARADVMPTNMTVRSPASMKVPAVQPKMQNICMIKTGDIGDLKFKGSTYNEAFSKVTDECFQRRTQLFVRNRNQQPDQDRQIDFAEACLNEVSCI